MERIAAGDHHAEVPLHGRLARGRVALVDSADLDLVSGYRWWVSEIIRPGRLTDGPYAYTTVGRSSLRMHQLITGWPLADHQNHDGLDNRRANLRKASDSQNHWNRRKGTGTSSRFIGVCWAGRQQRWVAHITVYRKRRHLGSFTDEVEAAKTRDLAAIELHGEFASLNFPGSVR